MKKVTAFLATLTTIFAIVTSDPDCKTDDCHKDEDLELLMVHLVFRHGDRTPDFPTYPLDPHRGIKYPPYGFGQMTKPGYNRCYEIGRHFRNRYDSFLGSLYNQTEVHAQSTGLPRTRMALQLVMAGLFPPNGTELDWNANLNWQPFDMISLALNSDPVLMPLGQPCPRLGKEFVGNYAHVIEKNKEIFDSLSKHIGAPITKPFDIIKIGYDLRSEEEYGLVLPEWTKKYYPKPLHDLSNEAWSYIVHNEIMKRMMGGKFLEKLFHDWDAKIENATSKKLVLFSGHDATIIAALGVFNVWDPTVAPDYGITAAFELKKNRKTGEIGVQVFMRNHPNNEPVLLTIPGCKSFCPLAKLKTLLSNHLPNATDCAL